MKADLRVQDHGSIVLLVPATDAGRAWLEDNVGDEETQMWGDGVVCEPRYVGDILRGAVASGLVVR